MASALANNLSGRVYAPGDAGYTPEVAGFNTAVVHTPNLVVAAAGDADILGGGLGPLARSRGFSSDYLVALTVVTGAGDRIEASTESCADMFWALRGGQERPGHRDRRAAAPGPAEQTLRRVAVLRRIPHHPNSTDLGTSPDAGSAVRAM